MNKIDVKPLFRSGDFALFLAALILFLVLSFSSEGFLTPYNVFTVLRALSLYIAIGLAQAFPLVIGNLAAWILSVSDRYILEIFQGSEEVGIYSASYNISERSIMLITALFMLASGPISIHIWEKESKEKLELVKDRSDVRRSVTDYKRLIKEISKFSRESK